MLSVRLIFAVESPTATAPNGDRLLIITAQLEPRHTASLQIWWKIHFKKRRRTELKATALLLQNAGPPSCTCSFWNGNDTSRNKRRIKNTIPDGLSPLWMMYLLVFIHLGHNIRFSPACCVKSLLPTPQLSLLPLQWEKWRQYQRKCGCLSERTRNSVARCGTHTAAIVLSETFIVMGRGGKKTNKKNPIFTVCQSTNYAHSPSIRFTVSSWRSQSGGK